MSSNAALPPLYAGWMDRWLLSPVPSETEATCDRCVMCAPNGAHPEQRTYEPNVKCCSYWPSLPNFLVGGILSDTGTGPSRVRKLIESQVGVTPLGLAPSPTYQVLYDRLQPRGFGRALSLRCPYYLDEGCGSCTIWKHRACRKSAAGLGIGVST